MDNVSEDFILLKGSGIHGHHVLKEIWAQEILLTKKHKYP